MFIMIRKKLPLERFIAAQTPFSRREILRLLVEGRITVNSNVATALTAEIDPQKDTVKIDKKPVRNAYDFVYYKFYKPKNVISTLHDPSGRLDLSSFVSRIPEPVFPVGRLDRHTTGLYLLTNDGPWAQRMTHPRFEIPKAYVVEVNKRLSHRTLRALTHPIPLSDDTPVSFVHIAPLSDKQVEVVISEGRNRIVRRAFEALGLTVIKLKRIGIGPVTLSGMKAGDIRPLTKIERMELDKLTANRVQSR